MRWHTRGALSPSQMYARTRPRRTHVAGSSTDMRPAGPACPCRDREGRSAGRKEDLSPDRAGDLWSRHPDAGAGPAPDRGPAAASLHPRSVDCRLLSTGDLGWQVAGAHAGRARGKGAASDLRPCLDCFPRQSALSSARTLPQDRARIPRGAGLAINFRPAGPYDPRLPLTQVNE